MKIMEDKDGNLQETDNFIVMLTRCSVQVSIINFNHHN